MSDVEKNIGTHKPEFAGEWVRLGDVIKKAKSARCGSDSYPILSITMRDGIVEQASRFKKSIASRDTGNYKVVEPGQLVVGFPIDEGVIYVQNFNYPGIMSPAYDVWDIDSSRVDPSYLELALHSPQSMDYYRSNLRGTTARRRSLPTNTLCDLTFLLPSLENQRIVVKRMSMIVTLLDDAGSRLSALDNLVKSQFVEMFGDPIRNEKGYPEKRLGELLEIARGGSPRPIKDYLTNDPEGINWIKNGDTVEGSRYINSTAERIKPEGKAKSREVKAGDFLLSNSMSFGRPYILNIDGCIHDGWLVLSDSRKRFNKVFLCELLGSSALKAKFSSSVRGGVVNNLNIDLVANTVVPYPPLSLQQQFADFVARVDKLGFSRLIPINNQFLR